VVNNRRLGRGNLQKVGGGGSHDHKTRASSWNFHCSVSRSTLPTPSINLLFHTLRLFPPLPKRHLQTLLPT
ncbi:hypothetical protein PIB30_098450, partial [Stylosanthes scabra]|nr:hypothetical protein [Stylosanthes scabra]